MDNRVGLVVTPNSPLPSRERLSGEAPVRWLRSIVYDLDGFQRVIDVKPEGSDIIALVSGETWGANNDFWSDGWERTWRATVSAFLDRYGTQIGAIEGPNEWDFWREENKVERVARACIIMLEEVADRPDLDHLDVIVGSVAGPEWPRYLGEILSAIGPHYFEGLHPQIFSGFAFHPYGKSAGGIAHWFEQTLWEAIDSALDIAVNAFSKRSVISCWVTEFGIKIGDAGGSKQVGEYISAAFADAEQWFTPEELPAMCVFAYSDRAGTGAEQGDQAFGLTDQQGSPREGWNALALAATKYASGSSVESDTTMKTDWRAVTLSIANSEHLTEPDLFVRQIDQESWHFDPDVIALRKLSTAGAKGIAQFMDPTAKWVSDSTGVAIEQFWSDPTLQLRGAIWLDKLYLKKYNGRWDYTLAAYNAGPGNLARWLDPTDALMPFQETIDYLSIILGISNDDARKRLLPSKTDLIVPAINLPKLGYNPNIPFGPEDTQYDDFSCSIHTVQQMLESIFPDGSWTYERVYNYMMNVMKVVDAKVGFHDHTGALLSSLFEGLGLKAHFEYPVTFDQVWRDAGSEPIGISGAIWYHWVMVRGRIDEDTLSISNSAPGYHSVGQTLSRGQFASLGDFCAVHIDIEEGESPVAIKELQDKVDYYINAMSYAIDDLIIKRALGTGRTLTGSNVKAKTRKDARAEFESIETEALRLRLEAIGR